MDPITVGAVILAITTGGAEALGVRLWDGLVSIVRRPARAHESSDGQPLAVESGHAELEALQQSPADRQKAVALAQALLARANGDPDFDKALLGWWEQAKPVRAITENVTNTISGGTFNGPVLQGHDYSGLTFGSTTAESPASRPGDSDRR